MTEFRWKTKHGQVDPLLEKPVICVTCNPLFQQTIGQWLRFYIFTIIHTNVLGIHSKNTGYFSSASLWKDYM